jgi:NodT family efflux transporter outer membrane factor (OMF) lipoprotein
MIWFLAALLAGPAGAADTPEEVAEGVLDAAAFTRGDPGPVSDRPWWETLDDPALRGLLGEALAENADLQVAWHQLEQARAGRLTGYSPLLPQASFDTSVTAAPLDTLGFQFGGLPTGGNTEYDVYYTGSAMLNASLGVDLWGRSFLGGRAASYDALASEGNLEARRAQVASSLAAAWYDVVTGRQRVAIVQAQLANSRALLELVELRYEGGESTGLDVLQQRQQLAATEAQLPATELALESAVQRLAVLLGQSPAAMSTALPGDSELPALPAAPAVGAPSDLLENRPDLRAAMAGAEASRARRKAAGRASLPTLSLSAQTGWQGNLRLDGTDEWNTTENWGATAAVSVPLFRGLSTTGAYMQSTAGEAASLQSLRASALAAVQDVEGALLQEARLTTQLDAHRAAAEAARLTFEASRERYVEGLTTYVTVLNALNSAQSAELTALNTHRDLLGARIQLYTALGGGWTKAEGAP